MLIIMDTDFCSLWLQYIYGFVMQVPINDTNTLFVEQTIAIMKNLLDSHTEGSSEHLGQASIETMMLNLVRSELHTLFSLFSIKIYRHGKTNQRPLWNDLCFVYNVRLYDWTKWVFFYSNSFSNSGIKRPCLSCSNTDT